MTDRELMQQVLDALEDYEPNEAHNVVETLRARLAHPYPDNFIDALRFETAIRENNT